MTSSFYAWEDIESLLMKVFGFHGVSREASMSVSEALLMAEASGRSSHGLSRVPIYVPQVMSGKIAGCAEPTLEEVSPIMARVDACGGFAFPAIDMAIDYLVKAASLYGMSGAAVVRSHHFGEAGWHVERIAREGYVGLMFGNTPHAMNLWGGRLPLLGTNPIGFAAPCFEDLSRPLVVDLALSKVSRGRILEAKAKGDSIPEGWAYDGEGFPTKDSEEALKGSMAPMGEAKGVALAVMVELMSAALSGGSLSHDASSLLHAEGPRPDLAHTLIAIDPHKMSGGAYKENFARFFALALSDSKGRLPGSSRFESRIVARERGLSVEDSLIGRIGSFCDA
jgi:(2R)-3-sulfolactate dehydrogenase (NADP+)